MRLPLQARWVLEEQALQAEAAQELPQQPLADAPLCPALQVLPN